MNHITVGVYNNGQHVVNIVREEDLESHIHYNQTFRPGRLLFVDGKYVSGGILNKQSLDIMIVEWEQKLSNMDINTSVASSIYK